MTYSLGSASAPRAAPREWVATKTVDGDSFVTLAFAYNSTAKEIAAKNNVQWNVAAVQDWIISKGGKILPYDSKSNPGMYNGRKGEGWAVFTPKTEILLPKMNRVDGRIPGTGIGDRAPPAGEGEGDKNEGRKISWTRTALLVGFLGWAGYAAYNAMSSPKKKSPAPVSL